jgi:hypothetical protein
MLTSSTEVFVLVDVVRVLLPKGFHHLKLLVYRDNPMRLSALMHLARLQGLPELALQVYSATADIIAHDTATLLSGLGSVHTVCVGCPKQAHVEALESAYEVIEQAGLPCPANLQLVDLATVDVVHLGR